MYMWVAGDRTDVSLLCSALLCSTLLWFNVTIVECSISGTDGMGGVRCDFFPLLDTRALFVACLSFVIVAKLKVSLDIIAPPLSLCVLYTHHYL